GEVCAELVDNVLDEESAEADAGEASLCVRDRVEDRGVGASWIERLGVRIEEWRDLACEAPCERHLDEDERLVRHPGVKEGVETAVGIEPVFEVAPARHGVGGLPAGPPLPERRRRGPPGPAPLKGTPV